MCIDIYNLIMTLYISISCFDNKQALQWVAFQVRYDLLCKTAHRDIYLQNTYVKYGFLHTAPPGAWESIQMMLVNKNHKEPVLYGLTQA